jgi:predicted nucleic acid-binding protein
MLKIYLDNCCYNRPYDDQSQIRISLETQAKIYIQGLIKDKQIELVIAEFMESNESYYVGSERDPDVARIAEPIMQTGVKEKDAFHVACAILSKCDYFITTDDRLLKYKESQMPLVTPGEFIRRLEVDR